MAELALQGAPVALGLPHLPLQSLRPEDHHSQELQTDTNPKDEPPMDQPAECQTRILTKGITQQTAAGRDTPLSAGPGPCSESE